MYLYRIFFPGLTHKSYIGITRRDIKTRITEHCTNKRQSRIGFAIAKYGTPSVVILASCEDVELLKLAEIEAIQKYNTLAPNGYNVRIGGEGCDFYSEQRNEAIKIKRIGTKHTEETKLKMSGKRNKNKFSLVNFAPKLQVKPKAKKQKKHPGNTKPRPQKSLYELFFSNHNEPIHEYIDLHLEMDSF